VGGATEGCGDEAWGVPGEKETDGLAET